MSQRERANEREREGGVKGDVDRKRQCKRKGGWEVERERDEKTTKLFPDTVTVDFDRKFIFSMTTIQDLNLFSASDSLEPLNLMPKQQ